MMKGPGERKRGPKGSRSTLSTRVCVCVDREETFVRSRKILPRNSPVAVDYALDQKLLKRTDNPFCLSVSSHSFSSKFQTCYGKTKLGLPVIGFGNEIE